MSSLAGKHVLVTSGPTRAPIDAVRYVANRSTGRLGCAIAVEALRRGARVTLVAGPESAVPQAGDLPDDARRRLAVRPVETVDDLLKALEVLLAGPGVPDAVVHAMAVLDYVPAEPSEAKTPSGAGEWTLRLVPAPKVIRSIRQWAPRACLVQFKLEVGVSDEELRRAAADSARANRADLVVANDLRRIQGEAHPALVMDAGGTVLARPGTKAEIARDLCDLLADRMAPA